MIWRILAFGIIDTGLSLAALRWIGPQLRYRRETRRFRRELGHLEVATAAWSQPPMCVDPWDGIEPQVRNHLPDATRRTHDSDGGAAV